MRYFAERIVRHGFLAGLAVVGAVLVGCSMAQNPGSDLAEQADTLEKTPADRQADAQQRLTDALSLIYQDSPLGGDLRYVSQFVDLNGDGQREAVAFVVPGGDCRAGCDFFVFEPENDRYEAMTRVPTSKAPVFVLDHRHHGWHDLLLTSTGDEQGNNRQRMQYAGDSYVPVDDDAADGAKRTPLIESLRSNGHVLPVK
ncbi:hypothetical protein V5738_12470 [Salinisphaera sp. SPP-AMP-43]|uniref:hypothetical protein n=1 Tax=Salinisphaera sp. SPP-AMP-43 TaxID=3121288 RepID=UPI003C6E9D5A